MIPAGVLLNRPDIYAPRREILVRRSKFLGKDYRGMMWISVGPFATGDLYEGQEYLPSRVAEHHVSLFFIHFRGRILEAHFFRIPALCSGDVTHIPRNTIRV